MSDKNSAEIFGAIFELLSENPTDEHKAMAARLWSLTSGYDFNPVQMWADDALMKLGLAKQGDNCGGDVRYLGLDYEPTKEGS